MGAGSGRGMTAVSPPQLCTRVMPPDANPAWNEVLFFPLRVRCPLRPPGWGPPLKPLLINALLSPQYFATRQLPPVCDAIELAIVSG